MLYRECFHILGDGLTEVVKEVFAEKLPTRSQRTSLMLFSSKPGKSHSLKPQGKMRLSPLKSDFKVMTDMVDSTKSSPTPFPPNSWQLVMTGE
jgi:hypothetical protein